MTVKKYMHFALMGSLLVMLAMPIGPGHRRLQSLGQVPEPGSPSLLRLDRAKYHIGDCLLVRVSDQDQNKNPKEVETVSVIVVDRYPETSASGDRETITLVETDPNSGVFVNPKCLPISEGPVKPNDGTLQVNPGDIIAALYQDPDNLIPQSREELFRLVDMSADLALISGGKSQGLFRIKIDPAILPQELSSTPGQQPNEPPRPLAMVLNPKNVPIVYGEDQVIYRPGSDQELADFLQERQGIVVDEIDIPRPDAQPNEPPLKYFLIRLDPGQGDLGDLAYLAELFGAQGEYTFSSENAARLLALILEEQVGGRFVMHNSLIWMLGRPMTREGDLNADGVGGDDGFGQPWFGAPDIGLRDAILYLDLIDRNTALSVNVAFVDGGFAGPEDYEGVDNPDYGMPFATIPQGNCDRARCSGSAAGPFPIAPFCAGGGGPACDWHGTLAFGVAGAVANNGFGVMGVAGHARTSTGRDGQSSLMRPMFFKIGLPYMTNVAKAITAAVNRGADIINISSGFPCEPLLDIDICKTATRVALIGACEVLGTVFDIIIPEPIAEFLRTLTCGSLATLFHLTGVADEDALRAAVSRALARDVVVIASGPENVDLPIIGQVGPFDALDDEFFPCAYDGVICVGNLASDRGSRRPDESNPIGAGIDIWAPGRLLSTPIPGSGGAVTGFGGTSAAAPFITGVVTMMKAANPALHRREIERILIETSNPFPPDSGPRGDCVRDSGGDCVGYVNVLAAVQMAAGIGLSCTGWDEPPSFDTPASAEDLGTLPAPSGPGSIVEVPIGGDRSIHAFPSDEDWMKFRPPTLPGAVSGDPVPIRAELTLSEPAFGSLDMQLFEDVDPGGGISLRRIGSGASIVVNARNDRDYYIRISSDADVAVNDNCYGGSTLTIEVFRPPAGDRYAGNDSLDRAVSVTEEWEHEHWRCPPGVRRALGRDPGCPDVFENGATPQGAEEVWTMRISDLSIASATESDFFRIRIPNPADPADGGHDDIRPREERERDPDSLEPLPECDVVQREGFGPHGLAGMENVTIAGKLFIRVIPMGNAVSARPVSTEGESIRLYRDIDGDGTFELDERLGSPIGDSLQKTIVCPRSERGYTELVFSFGERDTPRDLFSAGGYEIQLEYKIEIERQVPDWAQEPGPPGGMPCLSLMPFGSPGMGFDRGFIPNEFFPFCPSDEFGRAHLGLQHPLDPSRPDCRADGPGCDEFFIVRWPLTGDPFDVIFASPVDLSFRLFDIEQNVMGEAVPVQAISNLEGRNRDQHDPPGTRESAAQANEIEKQLFIPQLAPGLYVLVVSGPEAFYTVDFAPPTVAEGERMLSVPDIQGAAGSTVTIPVTLSEGLDVSGLQFTIHFDPAILSPAADDPVKLGPLVPSDFSLTVNTAVPGQMTVVIAPPFTSPIPSFKAGTGPVVLMAFRVAGGASAGATSPLTLSNIAASDANANALVIRPLNGTFTVTSIRLGDVNQDGVVNIQDVIRLIQHLTGERPLTGAGLLAADVNRDGRVNVQDVVRLIQHLTGEQPLSSSSLRVGRRLATRVVSTGEAVPTPEAVIIPVRVDEGRRIAAARMVIEYDPAHLRVDETAVATPGDLVPKEFQLHANTSKPGRIVLVLAPPVVSPVPTVHSGSGTLFSVRFLPVDQAGGVSVRILHVELSDPQGRRIPVTVAP